MIGLEIVAERQDLSTPVDIDIAGWTVSHISSVSMLEFL